MGKYSKSERRQKAAYRDTLTQQYGGDVRVYGSDGRLHEVGDKVGKHGEVVKGDRNGGR